MEKATYKHEIFKTIDTLKEIETIIFTQILNLSMKGELKEVDDTFEINDVLKFDITDFKKLDDQHVKDLIIIHGLVEAQISKLKNLYPNIDRDGNEYPF